MIVSVAHLDLRWVTICLSVIPHGANMLSWLTRHDDTCHKKVASVSIGDSSCLKYDTT